MDLPPFDDWWTTILRLDQELARLVTQARAEELRPTECRVITHRR